MNYVLLTHDLKFFKKLKLVILTQNIFELPGQVELLPQQSFYSLLKRGKTLFQEISNFFFFKRFQKIFIGQR